MLSFILSVTPIEYRDKITYLYESFHDDMLRLAKSRLTAANDPDPYHNAEDVVQNCFLRFSKYYDIIDFECDDKRLKAYVMITTVNECSRFINKQQYFEELQDVEDLDEGDFLEEIITKETYAEAVKVIKGMDELYSIPLFYYFVCEMSPKNIAEFMNLSEKTVYTRISRGKAKLIEELNGKVMK